MEDLGALLLNQNIWNEQNAAQENFDHEMDEDEDRDAEGTFDGGVARGADDATERKSSSECELVRYRYVDLGILPYVHFTYVPYIVLLAFLFGMRRGPRLLPTTSHFAAWNRGNNWSLKKHQIVCRVPALCRLLQ